MRTTSVAVRSGGGSSRCARVGRDAGRTGERAGPPECDWAASASVAGRYAEAAPSATLASVPPPSAGASDTRQPWAWQSW